MKKLTAIMLSALMLTAFVPLQGHAENITENIEVIEENDTTILRAGNIEYAVNEAGIAFPENVVDKSVTSIYLPAEVNGYPVDYSVGGYPDEDGVASQEIFSRCKNLTEITVDPDNTHIKSVDGVLFSANGRTLYAYPPAKAGDYVIPEGTKLVADCAFWRTTQLGAVTVPESVSEVDTAFCYSSVTEFIGAVPLVHVSGLRFCNDLRSVTVRPSAIGTVNAWFLELPSLEYVAFTPEVIAEGDIAVVDCPKLKHIDLPQSIPQNSLLFDFVIRNCAALESVSMYNGHLGSKYNGELDSLYENNGLNFYIEQCPALREITIKQIPYVYSRHKLYLRDLPALEHINCLELPQSVNAGTDPANDAVFNPFSIDENCGHFTVSGHLANTNLRRWCEENGIPFESLDKRGDANLDGEVSVVDAVMLQRWLLGAAGVSCGENIDLNADGYVDIFDLALLKRMIMER